MAISKALQTQQWSEETPLSQTRYTIRPTWFNRTRWRTTLKNQRTKSDSPGLNHFQNSEVTQMAFQLTPHAKCRMAQRNLSEEEISFVLLYGQPWHKAGAVIIYLRQKDIPHTYQGNQRWQQLVGATVVITAESECVILTAYRNRHSGLYRIKHKPDYGWN